MIYLNEIFNLVPSEYKEWTICLNNAGKEELYSLNANSERLLEHISWKKKANSATSFRTITTQFCLQFMRLDRDCKYEQWLFLGAYENCGVVVREDGNEVYDLKRIERFSHFIERLIIEYKKVQGPKQAKINIKNIETIPVIKVLEKRYVQTSRPFHGFDKVSLHFNELKEIINSNVDNWRELLSNINGIYAITDSLTGKVYIGSTYGYNGVWQRWTSYVNTNGHGGDVVLKSIIEQNPNYANNFVFTLIETFFNKDGNSQFIQARETYWKKVFATRTFGYNKN